MGFGVSHLGRLDMSFLIIILWDHTVLPPSFVGIFFGRHVYIWLYECVPNIIYIISRQDILET